MSAAKGVDATDDESQTAEIGARVRQARKARGWTINDLAEAAAVAPNTANNIELGRKVRPGNLRAVIDAVEVDQRPEPPGIDGGVRLGMNLVQRWLEELPQERRVEAVQELTRFVMLYRDKQGPVARETAATVQEKRRGMSQ